MSPEQAEREGTVRLAKAATAARRGDHQGAFQEALAAWQVARRHPGHSGCEALAERAMVLLEVQGERADVGSTMWPHSDKRIKIQ